MSDEITVKVNSYGPGRPLGLVYFDPVSGRKKAKSSGTTDWREAERAAGQLEEELRAGRYAPPSKVTWGQCVERYTQEKLSAFRPKSRQSALESLGKPDRLFSPDKLAKVNAALLSRFQAELRKAGAKETTIAHHLRHVKAALRWAERQGMLAKAPAAEMPKAARGGVVTNKAEGKYAGLHDLRRGGLHPVGEAGHAPGSPAACPSCVNPAPLSYYVDLDAADLAEDLWAKHPATPGNTGGAGNTLGNNGPETTAELAGNTRPNFLS